MTIQERTAELTNIFSEIDAKQRAVVLPMLQDVAYMEKEMRDLRDLPQIRIHPKDKTRQQVTAAGKRYREIMQTYVNAIKTLLTVLQRNGSDGDDELLQALKEFEKQ
jgi:hypothetical protein